MPHDNNRVIIVGAGPVGLTAALALARRGIPSVLLAAEPESVRWSRRGNPSGLRRAPAPATAALPPLADEIPPPPERIR